MDGFWRAFQFSGTQIASLARYFCGKIRRKLRKMRRHVLAVYASANGTTKRFADLACVGLSRFAVAALAHSAWLFGLELLPTKGFSTKPLKGQPSAGEQKAEVKLMDAETISSSTPGAFTEQLARADGLLVLTPSYGQGDIPAEAFGFYQLLQGLSLATPYAVLGFGNSDFADFCGAATKFDTLLARQGGQQLCHRSPVAACFRFFPSTLPQKPIGNVTEQRDRNLAISRCPVVRCDELRDRQATFDQGLIKVARAIGMATGDAGRIEKALGPLQPMTRCKVTLGGSTSEMSGFLVFWMFSVGSQFQPQVFHSGDPQNGQPRTLCFGKASETLQAEGLSRERFVEAVGVQVHPMEALVHFAWMLIGL